MDNFKYEKTEGLSLGLSGKDGFIGRWQITEKEFVEFKKDLWHEGTEYEIVPFASNSDDFTARCLNEIIITCESDFISGMRNLKQRRLYVPMIEVNGKLICLHSQMPELTYDFLNDGVITNPMFATREFTPVETESKKYDYLSIWLSLNDVIYCSYQIGEEFDISASAKVVLMPVHYLSFDNNGKHYVMMSWGDNRLSNFRTTELPVDEHLTAGKPVFSKPLITLTSMTIVLTAICGLCAYHVLKLWNSLDYFVLYKLIILAIPLLLIYLVTWYAIIGVSRLFGNLLLKLDKAYSLRKQRKYVMDNIQSKLSDVKKLFHNISMPDYSGFEVKYDETEIKSSILNAQKSMANIKGLFSRS